MCGEVNGPILLLVFLACMWIWVSDELAEGRVSEGYKGRGNQLIMGTLIVNVQLSPSIQTPFIGTG